MNTYPFYVVQAVGGTVLSPDYGGIPAGMTGIINLVPGTFKSHMWWFGGYLDGKAGPVNLNLDFVYDYGSVDERLTGGVPNVDYRGWAARAKIDFPWEKFNFGVVGMYATGADARQTSAAGLPGDLAAARPGSGAAGKVSTRNSCYVVPPGSEQGPANGESMVVYSMEAGATGGYGIANNADYSKLSRGGFGGTWFAKLYGSMKIAPWYKFTLQGLYIGDTTEHGNTFGSAVKYQGSNILRDDKTIGWEFDLINEIQIYNNLRFFVGAGWLVAGPALDVKMSGAGNRAADNPWAVRTRLMYTF